MIGSQYGESTFLNYLQRREYRITAVLVCNIAMFILHLRKIKTQNASRMQSSCNSLTGTKVQPWHPCNGEDFGKISFTKTCPEHAESC